MTLRRPKSGSDGDAGLRSARILFRRAGAAGLRAEVTLAENPPKNDDMLEFEGDAVKLGFCS